MKKGVVYMYEAFELFSKNVREQLQAVVKGEVTTWFIDDVLHIKIYNHWLKFNIAFENLASIIISGRRTASDIVAEVLMKYKAFILHTYINY